MGNSGIPSGLNFLSRPLGRRRTLIATAEMLSLPWLAPIAAAHAIRATGRRRKIAIIYYSLTGHTKLVADEIHRHVGGDVFGIETLHDYPVGLSTVSDLSKEERRSGRLPQLANTLPNFGQYELVLVGGPVWELALSTPMMSFLSRVDLGSHRVAAFCTYTVDAGRYFDLFREQASGATLLPGLALNSIRQALTGGGRGSIEAWLSTTLQSAG